MTATARYVVVGLGAIGGTLAARLARRGHLVVGVERDPVHREAVRTGGLRFEVAGTEGEPVLLGDVRSPDDVPDRGELQRVLLAVKSQDTAEAAAWLRPRLAPDGYVVSCQNGDNESALAGALGAERVVGCFVDTAADVVGPGLIRDGGITHFVFGELDGGRSARTDELVSDVGEVAETSSDIVGLVWAKAALAGMYIATAVVDADTADVIDRHRTVMAQLSTEIVRIADGNGVTPGSLGYFDPADFLPGRSAEHVAGAFDALVAWQHRIAKKRTGPYRDIAVRRRRTEAHAQLDRLRSDAARLGLATPTIDLLDRMLTELEDGVREFSDDNLHELARRTRERRSTTLPGDGHV